MKRFLQDLHKGSDGMPLPLLLPPDVLADCEEIIFQLCDDPFEVKLRANYEVGGVPHGMGGGSHTSHLFS